MCAMNHAPRALSGASLQGTNERPANILSSPPPSLDAYTDPPGASQKAAQQPFPFLGLPKRIRRQIYELLPVRLKYVTGYRGETTDIIWRNKPVVILVLRYIERSIVQTCRHLAAEAEPILEIETMKLGPPRLIVTAEYFQRIPHDIRILRRMQDQDFWQRLRLMDADRGDRGLEDQRVLMWARILHLNMLSEKRMLVGIFVALKSISRWEEFEDRLAQSASQIVRQDWWADRLTQSKPIYKVLVEWQGFPTQTATDILRGEGMEASGVVDGDLLRSEFGVRSFRELFLVEEKLWKDIPECG